MEGADQSLKQQFQLLQERQLQRLQLRKMKEKEKESKNNRSNTARSVTSGTSLMSDTGSQFGVGDNLDLKLGEQSAVIGTSYLSEELVDHLNNQIRELKDENGRLFRLLSEKDMEIQKLKKKKNDEITKIMESQLTNETAATKIVELSKKIRDLTAEMESERTRSKQFQRKCLELQQQCTQMSEHPTDIKSVRSSKLGSIISLQSITGEEKANTEEQVDVKALQDRLKQTETKMAEYRNQCQVLKQEAKIAQKVLAQELGDNVNIQSILNNSSNYRGRAQQIIALQNKVEELKSQLEAMKPPSLEEELLGNKSSRKRTQDDKYKDELRRLEKERKEAQERDAVDRKTLEEEHHSLKQKMEAAKARNSALSREVKDLKKHLQVMVTKSDHDNDLIEAYEKQVERLTKLLKDIDSEKSDAQRMKNEATKQLSLKTQQDSNVVNQLKAIVADREAKVKLLEQELQQIKSNYEATHQHGSLNHYQQEQQPMLVEEETFYLNTERSTTDTFESQTPVATERLQGPLSRQSTQHSVTATSPVPTKLSQRPGSVQRKRPGSVQRQAHSAGSARAQNMGTLHTGQSEDASSNVADLQYQCQEYHMLLQAANVERDKVSELLHVVQKRLNQETETMNNLRSEFMAVRRQNVDLEKQLGRISLEKNAAGKKKASSKAAGSEASTEEQEPAVNISEPGGSEAQELQTTIEIQKDEIDALKAALQRTLQAKQDDLELYSRTIDETKQVFLQALRQLKQSKLQA